MVLDDVYGSGLVWDETEVQRIATRYDTHRFELH